MKEYIKPETKYLILNGEAVMIGGGDEEGWGSAMGNEASFVEEEVDTDDALPTSQSVWE